MRWLPIESNPDVMNKYISRLGVDTSVHSFVDVFGFGPDELSFVPQPVLAVLLLFPITDLSQATDVGQEYPEALEKIYFMKQTIGNACGTVGIIHALANTPHTIFREQSILRNFVERTKQMNADERAVELEKDAGFEEAHEEIAHEGQTEAVDRPVNEHFVAFNNCDGQLVEFDGRRSVPFVHGPTNGDTFIHDVAAVVRKFMDRDPSQLNFSMVAFSACIE